MMKNTPYQPSIFMDWNILMNHSIFNGQEKDMKNLLMHFKKNENWQNQIDLDLFCIMYTILKHEARRKYLIAKKQEERAKKKDNDEVKYKEKMAEEKRKERASKV